MRRGASVVILVLAAACRRLTPPQQAVVDYAEAVRRHDCEAVWTLISSDTRSAYEFLASDPPYHRVTKTAKEFACDPAASEDWEWKHHQPKTLSDAGNRVVVAMPKSVPTLFLLPGFNGLWRKYVDDPVDVVFENGAWHFEERHNVAIVAQRRRMLERYEEQVRAPVRR